jgi:hypothetical protein
MATTQRPETRTRPDLTRGFGYLTLNPAPRLRSLRERPRQSPLTQALRMLTEAIREAMQSAAKNSSTG